MTLNGVTALILRYFTEFVHYIVVKTFTFAISSPDEFLVEIRERTDKRTDIQTCSFQYFAPLGLYGGKLKVFG